MRTGVFWASSIGRCTVPVMMTGANTSINRWSYQHASAAPLELHEYRGDLPRAGRGSAGGLGRHRTSGSGLHPTTVAREINAGCGRSRYGSAAAQSACRAGSATVRGGAAWRRRCRCVYRICAELRRGRSPADDPRGPRRDSVEALAVRRDRLPVRSTVGAQDVKPPECLRIRLLSRRCRHQFATPGRGRAGRASPPALRR